MAMSIEERRRKNRERMRKMLANNPDYSRIHYQKHKEKIKKWNATHPDKVAESARKYRITHRDELNLKAKLAAKSEKSKTLHRLREVKNRSTLKGKLNCSVSANIRESLKGLKSGRHWESLVGYTVNDLKQHLEKKFKDGMTWDNYGQWHIDHKIPLSAFNFLSAEDIDFKRAWDLKNLQPLWAIENISKGASLYKPFQPSLAMAV